MTFLLYGYFASAIIMTFLVSMITSKTFKSLGYSSEDIDALENAEKSTPVKLGLMKISLIAVAPVTLLFLVFVSAGRNN